MRTPLWAVLAAMAAGLALAGCAQPLRPIGPVSEEREFAAAWDAATGVLRHDNFQIDRADRRAGVITTYPLLGRHWFEFWRRDAVTMYDVAEGSLQTIYRQATVNIVRVGEEAPAEEELLSPANPPGPTTAPASQPATAPTSEPTTVPPGGPITAPATCAVPTTAPAIPPPPPLGQHYYLVVRIATTRSDRPTPQVTSATESYQLYQNSTDIVTPKPEGPTVITVGVDEKLARVLREKIYRQARQCLTTVP